MMPLVNPSDCSIHLVNPTKQNLAQLTARDRDHLPRRLQLISTAATTAGIPCHFLADRQDAEWLTDPRSLDEQYIHQTSDAGPSWSNSGLAPALREHNRSVLVIGGFWLEGSVSFIALCALSSGFD